MFQKKPAPASRPVIDAMGSTTFSVFGADTVITGDVSASADLHVDGRIEGDIACTALVQGERSEILGKITVQSARLAGLVRGTVTGGELVILKSARIEGDLTYDTLTIEQGAKVDGRLSQHVPGLGGGDAAKPLMLAN